MMGTVKNRFLHRGLQALLAMGVALALTACGGPVGGGEDPPPTALDPLDPSLAYLTDVEAAERVQMLKNDAVSIANGFVSGALHAALQGVPYSVNHTGVPILEVGSLPVPHLILRDEDWTASILATGTFEYDETTLNWSYSEDPADELVARWRSQSTGAPRMELRVTWSPLVTVTYPEGTIDWLLRQLPTGWRAVLRREGVAILDVSANFAFRTCAGVRMAEPTRLSFSGFIGDGAARADVEELVLEAVGEDSLRLRADLGVRSGSLQLGIDASLSADLAIERDAACWPSEPEAIELTGTLRVTGPGPLALVRGDVTATIDVESGEYDLALRQGRFLSGDKRVDLVATIAATEPDPASRLFLTFAGGVVRDLVDFVETFGLAD
jgi:hypothetical protein